MPYDQARMLPGRLRPGSQSGWAAAWLSGRRGSEGLYPGAKESLSGLEALALLEVVEAA